MIFNHRHIGSVLRFLSAGRSLAAALLLAALTAACSSSVSDEPTLPQAGDYSFSLKLAVGDDISARSTTPADGPYDPGAGFENYIDLLSNDYRIYLFNSNNVLIHAVEPADVRMIPTNMSTQGSKTYELQFAIKDLADKGLSPQSCTFKLLMLANWRSYPAGLVPGSTKIDDLMKSSTALRTFTPQREALLSADERIPMFGVKLYSGISLDPDLATELDIFHLLRAYSKIEVFNSAESVSPIASAVLTRHSLAGYNAPLLPQYLQGEYVTNSYKNDYGAMSFRPTGVETDEDLAFKKDEATGSFFIYVPEFANLAGGRPRSDDERARIYVKYEDGEDAYIDFKYYDDVNADRNGAKKGDFFDLRRNYWYRYELNKGTVIVSLRVDVVPYVEVSLNPSFGFDKPIIPEANPVTPPWVDITDKEPSPNQ